MSKKKLYYDQAQNLYVVEQCTINEIASRVPVSEKTIRNWKDQGNWEDKRKKLIKSQTAFHSDLYNFSRKIMKSVEEDIENGEKVDPGRMYFLNNIIKNILKIKEYEDDIQGEKKESSESKKNLIDLIDEYMGIK